MSAAEHQIPTVRPVDETESEETESNSVFDKFIEGAETLRCFEIEELDGLKIYARRFTLTRQKSIRQFFDRDGESVKPEAIAAVVQRFALDEHGEKLFTPEQAKVLMRKASFHVMTDIAGWIVGKVTSVEEHQKNSHGEEDEAE